MALWGKLFQGKSKCKEYTGYVSPETKTVWVTPTFDKSQIRIVLFRDHEKGRVLLLDSQNVRRNDPQLQRKPPETAIPKPKGLAACLCKKPPAPSLNTMAAPHAASSSSSSQHSAVPLQQSAQQEPPKYQFNSTYCSPDVKPFGEMIFGTAALSYKGPSLKVHTLKCPQQLLISNVFIPNKPSRGGGNGYSDAECSLIDPLVGPASLTEATASRSISVNAKQEPEIARSVPVDVPGHNVSGATARQARDHDSGFSNSSLTSSGSWQQTSFPPSPGSSCSISSNGCNSLQRRWRRSLQCSLDFGVPKPPPRYSNHEDSSLSSLEHSLPWRLRRTKVGMGIVFKESNEDAAQRLQEFFFSHATLVEGRINKLRVAIEGALFPAKTAACWQVVVMEAFEEFQQEIYDLYTAPRLPNPVWLNMMAFTMHRRMLCDAFMKELSSLVEKCDTRHTNFFLSTLLTAVLTYHLAWVPTVTPAGIVPSRTYLEKHTAKWLDLLARSHPYNPLWAQLSDLCGAIGSPLRLSRTVVVGKKADVVKRFLYVLSYFIRCSEIHENVEEYVEPDDCLPMAKSELASAGSCGNIKAGFESSLSMADNLEMPMPLRCSPSGYETSERDCLIGDIACMNGKAACSISTDDTESVTPDGMLQSSATEKVNHWMSSINHDDGCNNSKSNDMVFISPLAVAHTPEAPLPCSRVRRSNAAHQKIIAERATSVIVQKLTVEQGVNASRVAEATDESCLPGSKCMLAESSPLVARVERVRSVGRADHKWDAVTRSDDRLAPASDVLCGGGSATQRPLVSRDSLRRLFSQELDEFDEYFEEVEPRAFAKASTALGLGPDSIFDEYFDDTNIPIGLHAVSTALNGVPSELCSAPCCRVTPCLTCDKHRSMMTASEANVVPSKRDFLLKVAKANGFLHWSQQQESNAESLPCEVVAPARSGCKCLPLEDTTACRKNTSSVTGTSAFRQESSTGETSCCSSPLTFRCATPNLPSTDSGLGPRRHASGSSTMPSDTGGCGDPFRKYLEIPMPRSKSARGCSKATADSGLMAAPSAANFGRLQLAGYTEHYLSDFVLHGTCDTQFERKLQADLDLAVHYPILDEPVAEAVCIIANTDTWTVQVASSMKTTDEFEKKTVMAAPLVVNMVESVQSLYKQKMSSEFCMMHLEDTLREMYFKSRMLAEYVNSQKKVNMDDLSAMLGFDISDLPLLLSIAATHSTLLVNGIY